MATGDDEETLDALEAAAPTVRASDRLLPGDGMLQVGETVARYQIDGFLGRGGMGMVFRARDPELDRALAIKVVHSRHHGGDRMLREAQAMARLDHPNVVPIFDVGLRGDQLYLVMPFLPGGTLGEWCRAAPRPWREVVARYIAAGRGLHAAHRAGLVHRDFKPDNVLIDGTGGVHVADFGLARGHHDGENARTGATSGVLFDAFTQDGELLGTPAYMAPEQIDGTSVDARADQFSFCVALYEGLYGVRPFVLPHHEAGIVVLREAMRLGQVQPAPADRDVPRRVRDVLARGLRDAPEERWPSMEALVDQLDRARGDARRWPWIIAAAALLVVIALGLWIVLGRETSAPARGTPVAARQLTFRGDIRSAALSPDGRLIAARAGEELVVVPVAPGGEMRSLIRDFGRDERTQSIAWTADSRNLMTVRRGDATGATVEVVDVETGARERHALAVWPLAAMSGPREIVSAQFDAKEVYFTAIDGGAPPRECPLPGDYAWIYAVDSAGGDVFVTRYHVDGQLSVVRTDRLCSPPAIALAPTKAVASVVDRDGSHVSAVREIDGRLVLERTPTRGGGVVRRSPPLPQGTLTVNGIVDDRRLVTTQTNVSWRLVRLAGDPAQVVATLGVGSFDQFQALSPDGTRVAVIDDRDGPRRALRVVTTDRLGARPAPLVTDVSTASWSLDGQRLAAMVLRDDGVDLAIVTAATGEITRIALGDASPAQPVWLDDRRVAYLRADVRTYVALDVQSRETMTLMDPGVGFAAELAVRSSDGALAWFWKHGSGGIYVQRPGQPPERVMTIGKTTLSPTWSPDGHTLWIRGGDGTITRYDVATDERRRVFPMRDNDATDLIEGLFPAADGSVVVQLTRVSLDLVVVE